MKKLLITAAALIAASACTAVAQTGDRYDDHAAYPAEVECAIRLTPTRYGMRFEALAEGFAPARGQYEFILTKDDRGGSSDIVQGGDFDLIDGDREVLGSAELSLERGARYRARLVLSDDAGEICRSERRS
jgi:hypothetical protein